MIRNVLSIGPNDAMNNLIKTVLAGTYKLTVAVNVFKGMNFLIDNKFELVIIDLDYQAKEAVDFLLHIHSSKIYKKPIIVLCSAMARKEHEQRLHGVVTFYFLKPFSPIELVLSIKVLNEQDSASLKTDRYS